MRQAHDIKEPTATAADEAAAPPAERPSTATLPRRRKHWSRWTWVAATLLFLAGAAIFYVIGAQTGSLETAVIIGVAYLLTMTGALAALAALSVKHQSGTPATVAALFTVAVLTVPTFAVAGAAGVRERAVTALEGVFGGGLGADSLDGAIGGELSDGTLSEDDVIELEGDGDPLTGDGFGDDFEMDPEIRGYLDGLVVDCENGDNEACVELYASAPIGSEYDRVASTCGGRAPADTDCATLDSD